MIILDLERRRLGQRRREQRRQSFLLSDLSIVEQFAWKRMGCWLGEGMRNGGGNSCRVVCSVFALFFV